ncbi:MAG: DUF4919 domain-containing protein, partial [Calditrichaceae bacterium]
FREGSLMKTLIVLLGILIIFSCADKKVNLSHSEPSDLSYPDTVSNYFLFEYVDSLTAEDYIIKLDSIRNELSDDFFTLRMAYTKTIDYAPYGSTTSDSLKKASRLIETAQYDSAITVIDHIHGVEYVNIPSHLYLGYIYEQLNDSLKSKFHYSIYEGLLNSIYQSGDGNTPKTAYIVISTSEEYQFLHWFNLQFHSQSLMNEDGYSFDLMETSDPDTKEEFKIYFNIKLPYRNLSKMFSK